MSVFAADILVLVHLLFVLFVVFGGLLVYRWPRVAWVHVPAFLWGAAIELGNWVCPLTPWEQELRRVAGENGYSGGFIEHYLLPLLYPDGLTREIQLGLAAFVLAVNALVYGIWLWRRSKRAAL